MFCKVISVTNQKGGVGKTTTTVNLGAALSFAGKKVLVVDGDPQGNLTASLGYTPAEQKRTIANLILSRGCGTAFGQSNPANQCWCGSDSG